MATNLLLPSRSTIVATALQEIQDQLPGASTAVGGAYAILANVIAAVCWPVYQPIAFLADQIFPSSSSPEFLQRHANLYKIPRGVASKATGYLKLTGAQGATQNGGTTFTDAQGQKFTFTANAMIATPAWIDTVVVRSSVLTPDRFQTLSTTAWAVGDALTLGGSTYIVRDLPGSNVVVIWGRIPLITYGSNDNINGLTVSAGTAALISWTADFTGSSGNLPIDAIVTLDNPAANVNATARVVFSGDGADQQSTASWAANIESIRAEYPAGGNRAQLALWSLGYLSKQDRDEGRQGTYAMGVDRTFIWPLYRGPGTADITPQGVAGARHLSTTRRAAIQEKIYPVTPTPQNPGLVAMGADIKVTDFSDVVVNVAITLFGSSGYPPDFDTSTVFLIGAGTTTTRLLLSPNPIGTMRIGDRVNLMSAGRLVQVRIVNVFATGIDIDTILDEVPANTTPVYSGSDLIIPVREALDTMFSTIGPGDTLIPSRWPAPTSDLPAELQRALIDRYVMSVPGVRTLTIALPNASIIPGAKQQISPGTYTIIHRL